MFKKIIILFVLCLLCKSILCKNGNCDGKYIIQENDFPITILEPNSISIQEINIKDKILKTKQTIFASMRLPYEKGYNHAIPLIITEKIDIFGLVTTYLQVAFDHHFNTITFNRTIINNSSKQYVSISYEGRILYWKFL